nr:filament-like plant protein 4 isoform X3 [Physcomitrium patens]|eukprot:XP_024362653.1 filament-like plant protein 4 isoform X3 [Physcomitrella patens]
MKQLRSGREEQEQRIHETIVKKTQENDKLRAEMEAKLAEASHVVAQTRAELLESRAENKALSLALQNRSNAVAEASNFRARAENNVKVLQVRLEGMEKENLTLKHDIQLVKKELEARQSELEQGRKATEVLSKQHAEALKKITKLDEECTRLRTLNRKKPPSNSAVARVRQDVHSPGRDAGRSPRRRPLGRGQTGADHVSAQEEHLLMEVNISAEKIVNLEEETRVLKESLAKRDEELQGARIMCAKTASRLSAVEEEVEALRLASKSAAEVEKVSLSEKWTSGPSIISESSMKARSSKRDSLNFDLMDDFEEMERLANSQSRCHSVSGSEQTVEAAVDFSAADDPNITLRIAGLEEPLAIKDKDLEAANQMCHELRTKLAAVEEQLEILQTRDATHKQLVVDLQVQLDSLLENQEQKRESAVGDGELAVAIQKLVHITEALALEGGTESASTKAEHHDTSNSIELSLHWKGSTLKNSMSSLIEAATGFLENGSDVLKFVVELTTTLDCILIVHITAFEELRKDRDQSARERLVISMELESARVHISQLEEELCRIRADGADVERKMQKEMDRFPPVESEIIQLRVDKTELEKKLLEVDQHLVEANERVEELRVRLSETESLVTELQTRQAANETEKEEDLIEQELLELSFPTLGLASSMRAADAEMHQLHDKVAALEVELHGERRRHQEVVAKLEDLQEQIDRGVGRMDNSPERSNFKEGEQLQLTLVQDDATKSARKEKEIAAAALAECQRTILALGKQLKVLGLQEPTEISLGTPASPDSIEKMTQTMEFLRSQADSSSDATAPSAASPRTSLTWSSRSSPRPSFPGLHYRSNNNGSGSYKNGNTITDGPLMNLSIELPVDPSVPETVPSPTFSTPTRVLRSVRTIRGSPSTVKASANDNSTPTLNVERTNVESRSLPTSTFRRFYSRSQSETSMSSDHSSSEPVQ